MFIKKFIKTYLLKTKSMRLFFKYLRLNIYGFFPAKIPLNPISNRGTIFIFSSIGGHTYYSRFDRFLERCFNLKGYKVKIALCNTDLPICQEFTHEVSNKNKINDTFKILYCKACFKHGQKIFDGSDIIYLNDYSTDEYKKIFEDFIKFKNNKHYSKFEVEGISLGTHIRAGLIRFYGGYDNIESDKFFDENLLKFSQASIKTFLSIKNIIKKNKITLAILHHGIYVPQGIINDLLKKYNVDFYTYSMSYRSQTFFFAKQDTYHKIFLDLKNWDQFEFDIDKYLILKNYFKTKAVNNQDWIDFTTSNDTKLFQNLEDKVNLFGKKNTYIMYTNVTWDAQIHFKNNVFSNIFEWIDFTFDYFLNNPTKLLVVRSHPAEVLGNVKSRDSIAKYLNKKIHKNIKNVFVLKPLQKINSYKLMDLSDNYLIYSSKISIELLFYDKKILVAGEAFIRGKGFTLDVDDKLKYFENLNYLPNFNLSQSQRLKSYKFIYFFFFKLMIKTNLIKKNSFLSNYPFTFDDFDLIKFKEDKDFYNAICKILSLQKDITC